MGIGFSIVVVLCGAFWIGLVLYVALVIIPEGAKERAEQDVHAIEWCVKPDFYSANFKLCEELNTRP